MIQINLTNGDTNVLTDVFTYFATQPAYGPGEPGGSDSEAVYGGGSGIYSNPGYALTGMGFTYDATGRLAGGTITGVSSGAIGAPDESAFGASSETFTGLSLPVADMILLAPTLNPAPAVLAGDTSVTANSAAVDTYGGNDTVSVTGAGTPNLELGLIYYQTATAVDEGGGVNTAVFPGAFTSQATVVGGGGNETVDLQPGAIGTLTTATLTSVDKIQFVDGSILENNATPDAQAALMFLGVFGRTPDAANAGGFGQLAIQGGRLAAANAMLATSEGSADTTGLSNTAFVTRLYENMLHRAPEASGLSGWVADLDTGLLGRGDVLERFAASPEAQTANAALFDSGRVFAASPNAVEVLRAYTTLLGRLPEASALSGNIAALSNGLTLADFYSTIQHSTEFAADGGQADGVTVSTPYAQVYATLHGASVTTYVENLVNSTVGVPHVSG